MAGHLTFLTRGDCRLCGAAREVIDRVIPEYDIRLDVVDVDSQAELARRYGEQIPVLLVDGAKAFKFRIDERRLRRRLRSFRRPAATDS